MYPGVQLRPARAASAVGPCTSVAHKAYLLLLALTAQYAVANNMTATLTIRPSAPARPPGYYKLWPNHAPSSEWAVDPGAHRPQDGLDRDPVGASLRDYDGVLDVGPPRACAQYFIRRVEAIKCRVLPAPAWWTLAPIALEVCDLPEQEYLISMVTPPDMHAMFHAHLVGPQVLVPPISTCAIAMRSEYDQPEVLHSMNSEHVKALFQHEGQVEQPGPRRVAAAHQLLLGDLVPGDYELTLRMVYANFSFSVNIHKTAPGACEEPLWTLPVTVSAGRNCTYCDPNPQSWPTCSGRFIEDGTVRSGPRPNATRVHKELGQDPAVWQGKLTFQPKGCNLVPRHKIDVGKCFTNRRICFIGDSHLRYALNGLSDAMHSHNIHVANGTNLKTVFANDHLRLIWEAYGDLEHAKDTGQLGGCTEIVMAFISWPLGPATERWTAGHYIYTLVKAFKLLTLWKNQQMIRNAYFMTTPYHALKCGALIESRNPPFQKMYNQLAVMAAQRHNISVINTEPITAAMFESAADGFHHHFVGFVGYSITDYLLNVFCVQ